MEQKYYPKLKLKTTTSTICVRFIPVYYRSVLFPRAFYEINAEWFETHSLQPLQWTMYYPATYLPTPDSGNLPLSIPAVLNLIYPSMNEKIAEGIGQHHIKKVDFYPNGQPGHRDCMVGNNPASVVADAYIKGLQDYDIETVMGGFETWSDTTN